jgi:hypothetical protein
MPNGQEILAQYWFSQINPLMVAICESLKLPLGFHEKKDEYQEDSPFSTLNFEVCCKTWCSMFSNLDQEDPS